jgi:hypothetical protein
LFGQPLVTASNPKEDSLKRLRFDATYKFKEEAQNWAQFRNPGFRGQIRLGRKSRGSSLSFFDGVALRDPIGIEISWEPEHSHARKPHLAQRHERRAEMRALRKRATAAV